MIRGIRQYGAKFLSAQLVYSLCNFTFLNQALNSVPMQCLYNQVGLALEELQVTGNSMPEPHLFDVCLSNFEEIMIW